MKILDGWIEKQLKSDLELIHKNPDTLIQNPSTIIRNSINGKIKTLLLQKGKDIYGEFDPENDYVFEQKEESANQSLSNLAAIHTTLNQGNVYLLEKELVSITDIPINAIVKK